MPTTISAPEKKKITKKVPLKKKVKVPEDEENSSLEKKTQNFVNFIANIAKTVFAEIESLKDGEQTTIKKLSERVMRENGIEDLNIAPLVSMIVHAHDGVVIERGRFGGVWKGQRPLDAKPNDGRPRCADCGQILRPAEEAV